MKATLQLAGQKKKLTLKAADGGKAEIAEDGPTTVAFAGGEACEATLGADGLSGFYGGYDIDGARNFFTSKDKGEQNAANNILAKWTGPVNVAWNGGTASVSIGKKGKAKVAIMLANGTKTTTNARLLVGEERLCVPVVETKKTDVAFALWLPRDGGEVVVEGLPNGATAGRAGSPKTGAKFCVSKTAELWKQAGVLADYLPDGTPITLNMARWTLPKAGKVAYLRGTTEIDASKLGENPSGLKLTYKAKDGSFKGSFKAYAAADGKLKKLTVNVTGVMIDGKGYGSASIKKLGGVAASIE